MRIAIATLLIIFAAVCIACSGGPNNSPAPTQQNSPPTLDDRNSQTKPQKRLPELPEKRVIDWSKVGNKAHIADVEFELVWAGLPRVSIRTPTNQIEAYDNVLVLAFKITNISDTKIARFQGWLPKRIVQKDGNYEVAELTVSDEFDNHYKTVSFEGEFLHYPGDFEWQFHNNSGRSPENKPLEKCESQAIYMAKEPLHPGKCYGTYLFFEKPIDKATEVRLLLSGAVLETDGEFPLRQQIKRKFQQK
jgi:hypothetical protein